jgi:hypothetical protein
MGFPVAYGGYAKVAWRSYPLVRARDEGADAKEREREHDVQRRAGIDPTRPREIQPLVPWGEKGMGEGGRFWSADHGHVPIAIENLAACHLGAEQGRDARINDAAGLTHNGHRLQPRSSRSSRTLAMAPKLRARDLIRSITRHCHDVASWQPSFAACDKLCVEQEQQIWQPERRAGMTSRKRPVLACPRGGKNPIGRALPSPCWCDRCVFCFCSATASWGISLVLLPLSPSLSSALFFPRPPF